MFGKPKLILIFLSASVVLYGLVGGLLEDVAAENDVYGQLEIFSSVLAKLEKEYVEHPDLPRAMNGALLGMLEQILELPGAVLPLQPFCSAFETLRFRLSWCL